MKTKIKLFSIVVMIFSSTISFGQDNNVVKDYFALPTSLGANQFKHIISLSSARLPEDYIEEASDFLKAPLIGYSAQYGLPKNFIAFGNVSTNIITWQLALGAKWYHSFNKFSFSIGYDIAYVYGQLKQFGFNSKISGWMNYPNLTLGYELNDMAFSLITEGTLVTSMTEYQDDIAIVNDYNEFAGVAFTLLLEQPLWKNRYLSIGIKINYTNFYYPAWAAYETFEKYYWIPEFKVGLVL